MTDVKRMIFELLLCRGRVFVTVTKAPGLDLPEYLPVELKDATTLEYGLDIQPKPIPDLEVSDAGIGATLSLRHTPTKTFVPWGAVIRMFVPGETVILFPIEVDDVIAATPTKPTLRSVS